MPTFARGDTVELPLSITTNGQPVDPSNLFLTLRCSGQQKTQIAFPGIIQRTSTGQYFAVLVTAENGFPGFGVGTWTWTYSSTDGFLLGGTFDVVEPCIIPSWLAVQPPQIFTRVVDEPFFNIADLATASKSFAGQAFDSFSVSDLAQPVNFQTVSDLVQASDLTSHTLFATDAVTDTALASDPASGITPHLHLFRSVSDTASASDATSIIQGHVVHALDTISFSDATTFTGPASGFVRDSALASDSADVAQLLLNLTDTALASDPATIGLNLLLNVAENDFINAGAPFDTLAQNLTLHRATAGETAHATDATTRHAVLSRSVADTAHATDVAAPHLVLPRTIADTAHATDSITTTQLVLTRSVTETANASDTAVSSQFVVLVSEPQFNLNDNATGAVGVQVRTPSDFFSTLFDTLTQGLVETRSATDNQFHTAAAPQDSATRIYHTTFSVVDNQFLTSAGGPYPKDAITQAKLVESRAATDNEFLTSAGGPYPKDSAAGAVLPASSSPTFRLDISTLNSSNTFLQPAAAQVAAGIQFRLDLSTLANTSTFLGTGPIVLPRSVRDTAPGVQGFLTDFPSNNIGGQLIPSHVQTGTTYTVLSTDAFCKVVMTNAANNVVTIPTGVFVTGTWFYIVQFGVGQTVFQTDGGGLVIDSASVGNTILSQYCEVFCWIENTNSILITGGLGA